MQVWDGRNGQARSASARHSIDGRSGDSVFSPDRRHLALGERPCGEIKPWDATRLEETQTARLTLMVGVRGQWLNIAFSAGQRRRAW